MALRASIIELFSCVSLELSPCSLNVLFCIGGELAKGMEKSKGLLSSCPSVSANVKVLFSGGVSVFSFSSLAAGAYSLVSINTPFFFWFLGPLLTSISMSSDVGGTSSSASHTPFTPPLNIKQLLLLGEGPALSYSLHGTSL